jgi:hypothetical protein
MLFSPGMKQKGPPEREGHGENLAMEGDRAKTGDEGHARCGRM